jgi:hypothetical protein
LREGLIVKRSSPLRTASTAPKEIGAPVPALSPPSFAVGRTYVTS